MLDDHNVCRRAEIARRLKAARWLLGDAERAKGRDGKPHRVGWKAIPVPADRIVARSPLAENGWKADRLGKIERMERNTTPMELDALEVALGLPGWFSGVGAPPEDAFRRFADGMRRAGEPPDGHPASQPATPPDEDAEGGDPG